MIYGGIEAGGTKFVCAVATEEGRIQDRVQFPTESPVPTVSQAVEFFRNHEGLTAIGIASFGPVDPVSYTHLRAHET